jgi:CRISPR-associated protein Cmr2
MDARKRLRDFVWSQEAYLKCSLCGARQELSGETSVGEARVWWQNLVMWHNGRLRIREDGSERLCGICAVKRSVLRTSVLRHRLDKDDGQFPSTSNVAAATFKRQLLENTRGQNELATHLDVLEHRLCIRTKVDEYCIPGLASITSVLPHDVRRKLLTFDGDLFYVETFTEKRLQEEFPGTLAAIVKAGAAELGFTPEELLELEPTFVRQRIDGAVSSLRALFRAVCSDALEGHITPPSKYFAVLKMDGDRMGAFFAGSTEECAQELSQRLSQFAYEQAPALVERHAGRLVYTGGDDAMALLPLLEVLPCARDLQEAFKQAVHGLGALPTRPYPPYTPHWYRHRSSYCTIGWRSHDRAAS